MCPQNRDLQMLEIILFYQKIEDVFEYMLFIAYRTKVLGLFVNGYYFI